MRCSGVTKGHSVSIVLVEPNTGPISSSTRSMEQHRAYEATPQVSARTTIGAQYNRRGDQFTSTTGTGLLPGSETITGAATITGAERNLESVVAGVYAEQALSWRDRLFLSAALRSDGSSSFGTGFNTALYPKFRRLMVVLSDRDGLLNSARSRTAYGASGVQPGSTAALTTYSLITVLTEGVSTSGAIPGAIGNADLRPERRAEFESGAEVELLGRRVSLEFTHYNRRSKDALIQYRLPSEVGVPSQWRNIGAVLNKGFEGLATVRLLQRTNLGASVTVTGSTNTNKIDAFGFEQLVIASPGLNAQGYPIFSRFARPILSYADANGNGILEASEINVGADPVYVGPSLPKKQISFSPELTFLRAQLRLSAQFDYRGGFVQYNQSEGNRCALLTSDCRAVNDKTAPLDQQARAVAAQTAALGSTAWGFYEDASFTRWRELSLSANLPARWTRWTHGTASVSLAGRNLALFTKYSGPTRGDHDARFCRGLQRQHGRTAIARLVAARHPRVLRTVDMRVSLRTFLALSPVVLLTACDGLTNINATDVVQPTSLGNAAGAEAQRAGAMGTFFTTYGSGLTSVVVATGLASDEFYAGVVPSTASTPDFRAWSEPSAIGPYVGLQRSRIAALTAVDGLKQYLPALKSKIGQMYAIAGYTEDMLAESVCSGIALGALNDAGTVFGTPMTTSQVLAAAVQHFDWRSPTPPTVRAF